MRRFFLKLLKTILALSLGVYLFWYFFHSMSNETLEVFYDAIYKANYFWIFLSLFLSFLAYLVRAYRWKYLIDPLNYNTSFWNRYHAISIGYLINYTIPRAGEIARATMLFRSDGVPFAKSVGTILVERAFDVIILLTIIFSSSILYSDDYSDLTNAIKSNFNSSSAESSSIFFYTLIGVAILILISLLAFEKLRLKVFQFMKSLSDGILSIFHSKNKVQFIVQTVVIWLLFIAYFGICYFSFPETATIPVRGIILGFIAGSIGITLTNGGIGVFPLVVGLTIEYYLKEEYGEIAQGLGFALGMIIWCSQTTMVIILGVISLLLLPKNFKEDVNIS